VYPADEVIHPANGRAAIARERRVSVARVFGAGCAASMLALLIGGALELARFGAGDAAAAARVEQEVRGAFVEMTAAIERVAHEVARDRDVVGAMASGLETDQGVRTLFDAAARARARDPEDLPDVAVTIYNSHGVARGWAGRASDLPAERPPSTSLFVAPSPLGLRLVYLEPVHAPSSDRARLGFVAVEHVLTPARAGSVLLTTSEYVMPTSRGPVVLRLHGAADTAAASAPSFVVAAADGSPLVDVTIPPGELAGRRAALRRMAGAAAIALLAFTTLLLAGPLLDARARARTARDEIRLTAMIGIVVIAGSGLLWLAFTVAPWSGVAAHRTAFRLLLGGGTAAALAATCVSAAGRLRVAMRGIRRAPEARPLAFVAVQLACGVLLAILLVLFERVLGRSVDPAAVDLRHFSLHPWSAARIATLTGVLLAHAAVLWTAARPRSPGWRRWRCWHG